MSRQRPASHLRRWSDTWLPITRVAVFDLARGIAAVAVVQVAVVALLVAGPGEAVAAGGVEAGVEAVVAVVHRCRPSLHPVWLKEPWFP